MKTTVPFLAATCALALPLRVYAARDFIVHDPDGALAAVAAPVAAASRLTAEQRQAALEGRLFLREVGGDPNLAIPAQVLPDSQDTGRTHLYALIEPGALLDQVEPRNRIYARARSDYIHPLFGPQGEALTLDWPIDHPHHRGIYWAWPEVDWRGERGDLHALQRVFARPVGRCFAGGGPVFAQLVAENLWKWDDAEPIVQERAVIRAYRATETGRVIDLEFQFTALREPVLLARRGTDKYGGLNLRFAAVAEQQITTHTDPPEAARRCAWAEIAGRFAGANAPAGVVILQHSGNPDFPGDWVQFPNLNWLQPTFPASGTRWKLEPGRPLVLRYRLWVHSGGPAGEERCAAQAQAYQSPQGPKFFPEPAPPKRPKAS
jgi:hypothetical protein